MKVYSLSASRIKTYKQCEFKHYLQYHLGLEISSSFAADQGSMVHVIFEKLGEDIKDGVSLKDSYIYNNWQQEVLRAYQEEGLWKLSKSAMNRQKFCAGCEFNLDGLCQIANEPIDKFDGCPKDEYQEAIWLCEKVIGNKDVMYPLDQNIINVEEKFKLVIPDGNDEILVNGIIDVVTELDKETIEIIDYKTGKYTQSYNECKKDPQMLIYNLAVRKLKDYKDVFITVYYMRKKPVTLTFEQSDETRTENAIKHYYWNIKNNESPKRRCDKYGEGTSYDYVCEKMCDIDLCNKEFAKFKNNGYKILPAPEKSKSHKKEWLSHLKKNEKDKGNESKNSST